MEKVDINTLTEEQKKLLDLWYKIYINNDWKLVTEEPEIFSKELIEIKIQEIKQKYNSIILDKYPYYTQINMSADIQEIHLNARNENRVFTEDEMVKVWEGLAMKKWIGEQRELCKNEILELWN